MGMQKESDRWHFTDSEVKRFFATAPRVYTTRSLDALALPATYSLSRLLVVTPKRMASAPERNRTRRRLREIFRTTIAYRTLPFDLLCIMKSGALKKTHTQLKQELDKAVTAAMNRYQADGLAPHRRKK